MDNGNDLRNPLLFKKLTIGLHEGNKNNVSEVIEWAVALLIHQEK